VGDFRAPSDEGISVTGSILTLTNAACQARNWQRPADFQLAVNEVLRDNAACNVFMDMDNDVSEYHLSAEFSQEELDLSDIKMKKAKVARETVVHSETDKEKMYTLEDAKQVFLKTFNVPIPLQKSVVEAITRVYERDMSTDESKYP
jgi:hypothetical protein